MTTSAIVLAAGKGTRMNSDLAKVLHTVAGRSLLGWILAAAEPIGFDAVVAVIGHQHEAVAATLPEGITAAVQEPQNGTGDAARVGLDALADTGRTVVVLPGDMPLLTADTVRALLTHHTAADADATVLTVEMDDPHGYGRVVRSASGVTAIVEERDADATQRAIREVNTSVYCFSADSLTTALQRLGTDNSQGEYYLTDAIAIIAGSGGRVAAVSAPAIEGTGVNSHAQLAAAGAVLRSRINDDLMHAGVAMVDPARVYVDAGAQVAAGAVLLPDTFLDGRCSVGSGAVVGPAVQAANTSIGEGAAVRYSVLDGAIVGPGANVGPFTYLRPGAALADSTKAGAFVEIKNSTVGPRSKVPHLSYIGDASIGEDTNIGAATVTVNYDGFEKHRTVIGDRVRIGSDTMLVAPVSVGDDAYTGAGSVITHDVAPGALGIERSPQKEVPGYAARRRRRAEADER